MSGRANAPVRKALGVRIRALRKELKLTQERLGEASGLSGKFIGEVERGEKSISIDSLYCVAAALKVSLPAMLDLPSKVDVHAEKILALLRTAPKTQLPQVHRVVRALVAA